MRYVVLKTVIRWFLGNAWALPHTQNIVSVCLLTKDKAECETADLQPLVVL